MNPPTRLLLVRHGEVEERYRQVFGGRIDMGLSAHGHAQARILADHLGRQPVQAIYASPMKRAQLTLAPFIERHPVRPVILPELREVDFGAWTGCTWQEVRDRFHVHAFDWLEKLEANAIPEAEPVAQFRDRVADSLGRVLRESAGGCAAVVAHGGVIRMLLALLLDLPLRKMASFEIAYASLTRVDHRPGRVEVQFLNRVLES
ncbi:MAG: phosphoglycerate mutase family protein [Verrucomicrobia bacterium]|nr:phosphoglycerate mutase family protein [Verrucomicrobiota bacterium]